MKKKVKKVKKKEEKGDKEGEVERSVWSNRGREVG